MADMTSNHAYAEMVISGGCIYAIGGNTFSPIEKYDAQSWTLVNTCWFNDVSISYAGVCVDNVLEIRKIIVKSTFS